MDPGRIEQRTGPASFTVELGENRKVRRHQDQIFARENNEQLEERTLIRDNEKELGGEPIVEDLEDHLSNDDWILKQIVTLLTYNTPVSKMLCLLGH